MKTSILSLVVLIALSLFAAPAHAEQRVIVINSSAPGLGYIMSMPDVSPVNRLLSQGWRIVSTSAAGTGAESRAASTFTYVFVLESPSVQSVPESAPASSTLSEHSSSARAAIDLKAIWQAAVHQKRAEGVTETGAAAFADDVVRAVSAANPGVKL